MNINLKKLMITMMCLFAVVSTAKADLVAYWDFNGSYDEVTQGYGQTVGSSGSMTFVNDVPGAIVSRASQSLQFGATNTDFIESDFPGITGTNAKITVSLWVKDNAGLQSTLVSQGPGINGVSQCYALQMQTSGFLNAYHDGGGGYSGTGASIGASGQWVHVAYVIDSTIDSAKYYVNGTLLTSTVIVANTNQLDLMGDVFKIGNYHRDTGAVAKGVQLAEVAVYNEVLGDSVITQLANGTSPILIEYAINPEPQSNAINIDRELTLAWQSPEAFEAASYLVTLRNDPNFEEPSNDPNYILYEHAVAGGLNGQLDLTSLGITLAFDTTHYWRVDSIKTGVATPYKGKEWTFTTMPSDTIIVSAPENQVVAEGSDILLEVVALNVSQYQWYKQNSPGVILSTTNILELVNIDINKEGTYICKLINQYDASETEIPVTISGKRSLVKWSFEQNLQCEPTVDGVEWTGIAKTYVPNEDLTYVSNPTNAVYELSTKLNSTESSYALKMLEDYYVEIPNSADYFNFYPQGMTLNIWFKHNQDAAVIGEQYGVASKYPLITTDTAGWAVRMTDDKPRFGLAGATTGTLNPGISLDNDWHMLTFVNDIESQQVLMYIDGVLESSGPQLNVVPGSTEPVRFGIAGAVTAGSSNRLYRGLLDDIEMWNYPLAAADIVQMFVDGSNTEICTGAVEMDTTGPNGEPDCIVDIYDFAAFALTWMDSKIVMPD
ncbi:MAG: hypothetical protein JEZ07_12135 [Phycisphaerae bacterium]|nr:hypothetical protein [Phycisphaerae bacterium]